MKRWGYWIGVGVALLALVALIGWARTYIPLRTSSASEEWSRGTLLGVTPVNNRVDVRVAPDGGVFLSWVDTNDRLRVARLGTRGQVISNRSPALGTSTPREPHLLVGPEDQIHLVWRETAEERSLLTYARLNSAGSVQTGPLVLSLVGDEAQSLNLIFNHRGEVEAFWIGQAGVYRATLSAEGEMLGEPTLLVAGGESVKVQVDQAGVFHIAWLQSLGSNMKAIYYATLAPGEEELNQPEEMTRFFLRAGQVVQSLVIGIDADTGYILWVIQDMRYVTSSAHYTFFPLEIPRQKKVRDLLLHSGGNPLNLGAMRGQHEDVLVALTQTVMAPSGPQLQIGIIAMHGEQQPGDQARAGDFGLADSGFGDLVGRRRSVMAVPRWGRIVSPLALHFPLRVLSYADNSQLAYSDWLEDQIIVTASGHPSLKPSLAVDEGGNLHLTWLETGGFGIYQVAYASTAPEVREAYNRMTVWDMTDRAMGLAMQFFMAVGLTPVLAIYWSLFPLGWLLVYLLVTGREHLTTPGTWRALGISVVLEVASTYLYYPHKSRMPLALQWIAPLSTAAVGLLLAMLYLRKRDEKSLFGAFFVFAIVHGVLQVMCFVLVR